jgi:hypothetical protein
MNKPGFVFAGIANPGILINGCCKKRNTPEVTLITDPEKPRVCFPISNLIP